MKATRAKPTRPAPKVSVSYARCTMVCSNAASCPLCGVIVVPMALHECRKPQKAETR